MTDAEQKTFSPALARVAANHIIARAWTVEDNVAPKNQALVIQALIDKGHPEFVPGYVPPMPEGE